MITQNSRGRCLAFVRTIDNCKQEWAGRDRSCSLLRLGVATKAREEADECRRPTRKGEEVGDHCVIKLSAEN